MKGKQKKVHFLVIYDQGERVTFSADSGWDLSARDFLWVVVEINSSHSSSASTFHLWLPLRADMAARQDSGRRAAIGLSIGFSLFLWLCIWIRMLYALKNCAAPLVAANFFLPRHNLRFVDYFKRPDNSSAVCKSSSPISNLTIESAWICPVVCFRSALQSFSPCDLCRCVCQEKKRTAAISVCDSLMLTTRNRPVVLNCLYYLQVLWTVLFLQMAPFYKRFVSTRW